MRKTRVVLWVVAGGIAHATVTSCTGREVGREGARAAPPPALPEPVETVPPSPGAEQLVADLRARFASKPARKQDTGELASVSSSALPSGGGIRFVRAAGGFRPRLPGADKPAPARVRVPDRSSGAFRLEDAASGTIVEVALAGARDTVGEVADGYVVYRGAHPSGATLLHHALPAGLEDYLSFERAPAKSEIVYELALRQNVAGLRMVAGALELLDASGAPRLRVARPYVVGADGRRRKGSLALEGCVADTNPAPPWGREVTPPGASACRIRVTWPEKGVPYPALLDPRWLSSAVMVDERYEHTVTRLPDGRVLVVGGRGASDIGAWETAEVYDPVTNSWTHALDIEGGRRLHTAVLLPQTSNPTTSGRVLVAGGRNDADGTVNNARLFNPANFSWSNTIGLQGARHSHTATLLPDGRVLLVGGMNGNSTVLPSVVQYRAPSGLGSFVVDTPLSGNVPRRWHTATLMTAGPLAGKVLVAGGSSGGTATTSTSVSTVAIYSPAPSAVGTWAAGSPLLGARERHTATALPNGDVLIAGGRAVNDAGTLDNSVLFEAASASWQPAVTMGARQGHTATLLPATGLQPGAQVLVAGGSPNGTSLHDSALLWNGAGWSPTAALVTAVRGHAAILLDGDRVFINGGFAPPPPPQQTPIATNASQIYSWRDCTTNAQCASGFCVGGICCDTACTDQCTACNLPGTVGTCTPKPNGTACNDGTLCTQADSCQAGTCTGSSPVVCAAPGGCQLLGACEPTTGICSAPNAPDGTACDDGNACTELDICQSGVCQGPTPVVCQPPDACHEAGTCNPIAAPPDPPSTQDLIGWWKLDGNGEDSSGGGNHLAIEGNVTPAPGRVGLGMRFDGASCMTAPASWTDARMEGVVGVTMMAWIYLPDEYVCPISEAAVMGKGLDYSAGTHCRSWTGPLPPYIVGGVNQKGYPGGWGLHGRNQWAHLTIRWDHNRLTQFLNGRPVISYGPEFVDPNSLTGSDPLFAIGCAVRTANATRMSHFIGTIDEAMLYRRALSDEEVWSYYTAADPCQNAPEKPNGTSCSDGNGCTTGDTCQAGTCTGGTGVVCPAPTACRSGGTCNSATGQCEYASLPNGTACSDDNLCTTGESCQAGSCTGGTPIAGASLLTGVPTNGPLVDGTAGWNRDPVADMTAEYWHQWSVAGRVDGSELPYLDVFYRENTIPNSMQVTRDLGIPSDSTERWELNMDLSYLTMTNHGSSSGQRIEILDDSGRVVASFFPELFSYPDDARFVANGAFIAQNDVHHFMNYTMAGWAHLRIFAVNGQVTFKYGSYAPVTAGPVDPTADWRRIKTFRLYFWTGAAWAAYGAGIKVRDLKLTTHTVNDPATVLDDGDACTTDTCDPQTGVAHTPATIGTPCPDGNLCNGNETCNGSGACQAGTPPSTDDNNSCTADACNSAAGVVHYPVADGTTCNDGQLCTQSETCQQGVCQDTSPYPVVVGLGVDAIGTLGGTTAIANDINAKGEIVGSSATASGESHAFFRAGTAPPVDLGASAAQSTATSINDAGLVVGSVTREDGSHIFRYTAAGGFEDLGRGGDGSSAVDGFTVLGSYAYSVNANGQIAGILTANGAVRGFRYTDGAFQALEPLAGGTRTSAAAIDDLGVAVGASNVPGSPTTGPLRLGHAARWDEVLVDPQDLNVYVDPSAGLTLVNATSASGSYIVGNAERGGILRPFRLHLATAIVEEIPTGWEGLATAAAVNSFGETAGWGYLDAAQTQQAAFIYSDRLGFKRLNDMIDPASGWDLRVATSINDSGEVVGWGYRNGQLSAFRLSLSPKALACGQAPNQCGGSGGTICLWSDGVVDLGGGRYAALFGYQSSSPDAVQPATNEVRINGVAIQSPQPAPPASLLPGSHASAYLPRFLAAQTLTWAVADQTVTASAASLPVLPRVAIGSTGYGVILNGELVTLQPDIGAPQEPTVDLNEPAVGDPFPGTIKGELTVGPTGAATYTVPIAIPPGIGGMAPNLSLVYNSQGGNGIAGQGWQLGGTSMIHLCPKTRPQDGVARQVYPHPSDPICIDGVRLFERVPDVFETETKDFTRIERRYDPNWPGEKTMSSFVVTTKSGEIRYFGRRTNARVTVPSSNVIVAWALDRVADAWGNYYDLYYNNNASDFLTNGIRVTSIKYTGHDSGQLVDPFWVCPVPRPHDPPDPDWQCPVPRPGSYSATEPFNTIVFHYDDRRPDIRSVRFGTVTLPRKHRLLSISTTRGTYSLTYLPDHPMLPSRLERIRYCEAARPLPPPPAVPAQQCAEDLVFDWEWGEYGFQPVDPASAVGPENSYELPARLDRSSTQFVDLNGDGRVDLVESHKLVNQAFESRAWINNGRGWTRDDRYALPAELAIGHWAPAATRLVDIDGDGLVDLVSTESRPFSVWLNRINRGGAWEHHAGLSTVPAELGSIDLNGVDAVADMDGDGRADLVRLGPHQYQVQVFNNTGSGWVESDLYYSTTFPSAYYRLADINRDGIADLVPKQPTSSPYPVEINTAPTGPGSPVWVQSYVHGDTHFDAEPATRVSGDIDGDGLYDSLIWDVSAGTPPEMLMATGLAYQSVGTDLYRAAAAAHGPTADFIASYGIPASQYYFNMADLNADGLADLIIKHPGGVGRLLVNTGTTWQDPMRPPCDVTGAPGSCWVTSPWPNEVPRVPVRKDGFVVPAAFVDLNGDGVTDLVEASGHVVESRAWLNTFRPPVIKWFPNGLARKSEVLYAVITTEEARTFGVYDSGSDLQEGTTFLAAPLRVVTQVRSEDGRGVGALSGRVYSYRDLRGSATGRGPQGFKTVIVQDELTGQTTTTEYAQAYPYTGRPTKVTRTWGFGRGSVTLSTTTTRYCDAVADQPNAEPQCTAHAGPPGGAPYPHSISVFVYPREIIDETSLFEGDAESGRITTTTKNTYDRYNNLTKTAVTIATPSGETREKTTESFYGTPDSQHHKEGKPTRTIVTSRRLDSAEPTVIRTTEFDYRIVNFPSTAPYQTFQIVKSRVEPGAGPPLELHTAYGYDQFGHVTTTTVCADGFTDCEAGRTGPAHLPFRTTSVSYDPAHFHPPPGAGITTTLGYGPGRFPVRTTNPEGHVEYTAYEPVKGVLTQKTGPNGIHTCYLYDVMGRLAREDSRCGTADVSSTITERRYAAAGAPPPYKLVTVTRAPTGESTWTFGNVFGQTIETVTHSFDGGYAKTLTEYDTQGRVQGVSKPFFANGSPSWTTTSYDHLGRLLEKAEALGFIDDSGQEKERRIRTFYEGATVRTEETVNGQLRSRRETKNALGKVASVVEGGMTLWFWYDAEGNLLRAGNPQPGNPEANIPVVELHYDGRGRKDWSTDPDMGRWEYQYNGFGDLVRQQDAKGQVTTMTYDRLGRMLTKTEEGQTSHWVYDVAEGAGIGKLAAMISAPDGRLNGACQVAHIPDGIWTDGNRAGRSFRYTEFGDLAEVTECADGDAFTTSFEYDRFGRQTLVVYPQVGNDRLAVSYRYTSLGFLHYLSDASNGAVYWAVTAMNAMGEVTTEQTRNGVETISNRNPATGWLMGRISRSRADADRLVQAWAYRYDQAGNVRYRGRADEVTTATSEETFTYDVLNRLRTARVQAPGLNGYDHTTSYDYDKLGNLVLKGNEGFGYDNGCLAGSRPAGPHAVCTVTGADPFVYDGNGNLHVGNRKTIDYNVANKPIQIVNRPPEPLGNDGGIAKFIYGADGHRVVQTIEELDGGPVLSRTVYVGLGATGKSFYERTIRPGAPVEHAHFLYAGGAHGGSAFAVRVVTTNGGEAAAPTTKYYHFDHLGSVTAMSDDLGQVRPSSAGADADVLGYDPWGARRQPEGLPASPASFNQQVGRREFTGHETIPNVGLINMNGRVYDPALGRFLSPDPHIQFIDDLQSYNRYSYVLNNPLRYSDPTGYFSFTDLAFSLFTTAACITAPGVGCAAALLVSTIYSTTTMAASGMSLGQIVAVNAVGLLSGQVGGLIGGIAAGHIGAQSLAGQIVGGAIAGAVSGAITTVVFGGNLGANVLTGLAEGAFDGGLDWGRSKLAPVSQAAAQGESDGKTGLPQHEAKRAPPSRNLRDEVEHTLLFQKDARAAYQRLGSHAVTVDELEADVDATLGKKYGRVQAAATTDQTGKTVSRHDPNPYTREATRRHEAVHRQTIRDGLRRFGGDTPEYRRWLYNPQNWAADEVKAYTAGIDYLETVLRRMDRPK